MTFNQDKAYEFLNNSSYKVPQMSMKSKELKDRSKYYGIISSIENLARANFGHVEVHLFGSRIIGLATDSSDLDIFVDLGGKFYSSYKISSEHDANYRKLVNAIRNNYDWIIKEEVLRTAVPIIITKYKPSDLDCDINITNGLGTANSRLLAHLFDIQPEAVSFFHFVKLWFKAQGFDSIKGYTLALMVIFFLQSLNLMPSVQKVQLGVSKITIDGWEVQFQSSRSLESYGCSRMNNYRSYLKGFFKYYKDFDFNAKVISPFYGTPREVFAYKSNHFKFLLKGLYIAGPINQGKNCGIMDTHEKLGFIQMCKESSSYLNETRYI